MDVDIGRRGERPQIWKLFVWNDVARAKLISQNIVLGGKAIPVSNKNPLGRLGDDGEEIKETKLTIGNIPPSFDETAIESCLSSKGVKFTSKLRTEYIRTPSGKLTNKITGRRTIWIETPEKVLPRMMRMGPITATLYYREMRKCGNCLQHGHTKKTCKNREVCLHCKKEGHKKEDCIEFLEDQEIRKEEEWIKEILEEEKRVKREQEMRRKEEEERKSREEEEKRTREEGERKAREEEETRRKGEEERKQQEMQKLQEDKIREEKRQEAEEKRKLEAEAKRKHEAEEKRRQEAEEKRRKEAEEKRKQEAEEKRKQNAEEEMKRQEEEEKRKLELEEKNKLELAKKEKQDLEVRTEKKEKEDGNQEQKENEMENGLHKKSNSENEKVNQKANDNKDENDQSKFKLDSSFLDMLDNDIKEGATVTIDTYEVINEPDDIPHEETGTQTEIPTQGAESEYFQGQRLSRKDTVKKFQEKFQQRLKRCQGQGERRVRSPSVKRNTPDSREDEEQGNANKKAAGQIRKK